MSQATHTLKASAATVHWGFYDAQLPPVLEVASGDRIEVSTEPAGPREILPQLRERVSEDFRQIVASCPPGPSSHLLNGPVAVAGARPGDVLEVSLERVAPRYDWGYNTTLPLKGSLPEQFPYRRFVLVELDRQAGTGHWGPGLKVRLAPFFGNLGVAPADSLGRVPSGLPGQWGGNLDNKELTAGSRLLLPIFQEGALFSLGDGHACQGDGEVNSFALETGLEATVRLSVRRDLTLRWPRAETPTHLLFMGFDPILDNAFRHALEETLSFLSGERGLGGDDAYALCSLAVDFRVTQVVNGLKGVHAMLARSLLE